MKVLHLSSERSWRGGEQQIAYLIAESKKLGVESFVAARKESVFEEYCIENNLPYISLGFKSELHLPTALGVKAFCDKNGIDIVHMHSSHSHAIGVLAHLMGNRSKLVLSRRVDFPVKDNFASRFKFNYKGIEAIICISDAIRTILTPSIKKKEIVYTAYSGIDINRFKEGSNKGVLHQEFKMNSTNKIVANISAVADQKDYFTFIETARLVLKKRNDVVFFIIGAGPMFDEIRDYINNLGLEQKIIMTGFRSDISDIIKELDVFLITSKTEGLGTTILDAFANRIPLVATLAGGIPELVRHNETGLTAPIKDAKQLASHVCHMLDNEGLAEALTNNAHDLLLSQFTKDKMALANVAVYNNVLKLKN